MKPDQTVARLRWLMAAVILFDVFNTLVGQPKSFWTDPSHASEYNQLIRLILVHGWQAFAVSAAIYLALTLLLVSVLPRKLALMLLLAVILGHFFGAATWLAYHSGFGLQAAVIYAIVLAVLMVALGYGDPVIANSEMPAQGPKG